MNADQLFSLANLVALAGWACLLASPWWPRLAARIAGLVIPGLLALAYTALIAVHWSSSQGGFGTLDEVMTLFSQKPIVLAGWIHYLAFDLFVGAWICAAARRDGMAFWKALLCLPPAFLFGPAGFLLFLMLRLVHRIGAPRAGPPTPLHRVGEAPGV